MTVELVYDTDCPNVAAAREAILRAFARIGRTPAWTEWDRSAPDTPDHARGYGSPTILVDGQDVAAGSASQPDTCRLYASADGSLVPIPSVELIAAQLEARRSRGSSGIGAVLAAIPASAAFLVPVGFCPACWPAYGAVLGSLGLGFAVTDRFLLPLAGLLLLVTLAALAHHAPHRRGYGPFLLALAGTAAAATGKFIFPSDPILHLGLAAIFAAALWNAWPRRRITACPQCPETRSTTSKGGLT